MTNTILNNGVSMPFIGMGTWPLRGFKFVFLIRKAVKLGYRYFDLATAYGNERWFGLGLRFCGAKRSELFITTKLSNSSQRNSDARTALRNSLKRIGTKYLDLYLIHWPVRDLFLTSWKQMEASYEEGLVRAIGVCNFHQQHLDKLLDVSKVTPAVNQVELHPLLSQVGLVNYCTSKGIVVEAYTPIARMHEKLVNNVALLAIAKRHQKTIPQVILRWDFQKGIIPIPKSSNPLRLKENISILDFNLTEEEIEKIDSLNIDFRIRFDPDNSDFSKL